MKNTGAQLQDFLDKMLNSTAYQRGNATEYSPNNVTFNSASPLAGKKDCLPWLIGNLWLCGKGKVLC